MAAIALEQSSGRRRKKISITVDPDYLHAVDTFVSQHPGSDRSQIFDEAVRLWYAREQDRAMVVQYLTPEPPELAEEHADWAQIQAAAARRIFHLN